MSNEQVTGSAEKPQGNEWISDGGNEVSVESSGKSASQVAKIESWKCRLMIRNEQWTWKVVGVRERAFRDWWLDWELRGERVKNVTKSYTDTVARRRRRVWRAEKSDRRELANDGSSRKSGEGWQQRQESEKCVNRKLRRKVNRKTSENNAIEPPEFERALGTRAEKAREMWGERVLTRFKVNCYQDTSEREREREKHQSWIQLIFTIKRTDRLRLLWSSQSISVKECGKRQQNEKKEMKKKKKKRN
jgi:hypothetical protein